MKKFLKRFKICCIFMLTGKIPENILRDCIHKNPVGRPKLPRDSYGRIKRYDGCLPDLDVAKTGTVLTTTMDTIVELQNGVDITKKFEEPKTPRKKPKKQNKNNIKTIVKQLNNVDKIKVEKNEPIIKNTKIVSEKTENKTVLEKLRKISKVEESKHEEVQNKPIPKKQDIKIVKYKGNSPFELFEVV